MAKMLFFSFIIFQFMYCQVHSWTRSKWKSTHLIFGYCLMSGRFSFLMMFAPLPVVERFVFIVSHWHLVMKILWMSLTLSTSCLLWNVIDSIYIVLVLESYYLAKMGYLHETFGMNFSSRWTFPFCWNLWWICPTIFVSLSTFIVHEVFDMRMFL